MNRLHRCLICCALGAYLGLSGAACAPAPLSRSDCPGAPQDLALHPVAPFWGGLVTLEYKVPSGSFDYPDIEIFDPSLGAWVGVMGGGLNAMGALGVGYGLPAGELERDDGTIIVAVFPAATEQNRDLERKLRVRSRLDGCPASDWTESEGFKLSDPLVGTTWRATLEPGAFSGTIAFSPTGTSQKTYHGPYRFDDAAPPFHEIRFKADRTTEETIAFALKSDTPGDPYGGCTFQLHFVGRYEEHPGRNAGWSEQLIIVDRVPSASPTAGSTCADPALAAVDIGSPSFTGRLGIANGPLWVDYTGLLTSPPGPVVGNNFSGVSEAIVEALSFIGVSQGQDTNYVSVNGYVTSSIEYVEQ